MKSSENEEVGKEVTKAYHGVRDEATGIEAPNRDRVKNSRRHGQSNLFEYQQAPFELSKCIQSSNHPCTQAQPHVYAINPYSSIHIVVADRG